MDDGDHYHVNILHGYISDSTVEEKPDSQEDEVLEIVHYPEDQGDDEQDEYEDVVETIVRNALAEKERYVSPPMQSSSRERPVGYVSNARNAASQSDIFQFWAPAEEVSIGIGTIVRHTTLLPHLTHTYGIVFDTEGNTLGLDDYAIHVYEWDAQPPIDSIQPAPSARRPIVNYHAKVLASTSTIQRPVLSGPVYAVCADELASLHGKSNDTWLDPSYMLTGFYEDTEGDFGIFAEERARVLGPKQGHVILSGLPGAGKTSLFLTLVISLYAQLQQMEGEEESEGQ